MRIVPFQAEHGFALVAGQLNNDKNRPSPNFGNFIPELVQQDMAFTGIENGHLIVVSGVYVLWSGVGEGWFLASKKIEDHKVAAIRAVKKGLKKIITDNGLHRVQAAVRSDWKDANRLARYLGMQHEGTMRQYGIEKEDFERWAWVL